ncbi:hypothetical protein CsSME_00051838 [Camellia sinensis var. sinensis]
MKFEVVRIEQIGQEENSRAGELAGFASMEDTFIPHSLLIDFLARLSIEEPEAVETYCAELGPSWMDLIIVFLKDGILPEKKKEANKIRVKSQRFWLFPSLALYRKSFTGPYLKCVHPSKVEAFLFEIHEGICGSHQGGRSLAYRAISQGYWWPYMQANSEKYAKRGFCEEYKIEFYNSTLAYPQANGQAEASNKVVLDGLKRGIVSVRGFFLLPLLEKFLLDGVSVVRHVTWDEVRGRILEDLGFLPLAELQSSCLPSTLEKDVLRRFALQDIGGLSFFIATVLSIFHLLF